MSARNRVRLVSRPKGSMKWDGDEQYGSTAFRSSDRCEDHTSGGDNQPLMIRSLHVDGGELNTRPEFSTFNIQFRNLVPDGIDWGNLAFEHVGAPTGGDRTNASYAVSAAARTNPSRPYVDIPVNILQLGEVTRLIRRRGQSILRELGRENLRYQFGIAPLVGDLVKLANFQEQLNRRLAVLERLSGPTGYRRTVTIGSWTNQRQSGHTMMSWGAHYGVTRTDTTSEIVRVHLRWMPQASLSHLTAAEREHLAMRSVLGLTVDPSTLWEIVPWTWLIDWASNVGDWFIANRNIIPANLSDISVMRETHTEFSFPRHEGRTFVANAATVNLRTKSREKVSVNAPSAHFPLLTGNQMGILASLAVTRR